MFIVHHVHLWKCDTNGFEHILCLECAKFTFVKQIPIKYRIHYNGQNDNCKIILCLLWIFKENSSKLWLIKSERKTNEWSILIYFFDMKKTIKWKESIPTVEPKTKIVNCKKWQAADDGFFSFPFLTPFSIFFYTFPNIGWIVWFSDDHWKERK